jgi:hypothetical protein
VITTGPSIHHKSY